MSSNTTSIRQSWNQQWESILSIWSQYTKLRPPIFCESREEETAEGLLGSFAMIRLTDHSIVISSGQIEKLQLQDYAAEILAHEIGHHVFAPANTQDQLKLLTYIRASLPGIEPQAPLVANLYTDLLVNDRLQRIKKLRLSEVYAAIKVSKASSRLWAFYMRTYEILWSLARNALIPHESVDEAINADAALCARLIRSFSRRWLEGAGRFAALCYPYLAEAENGGSFEADLSSILDTRDAAKDCGEVMGAAEIDPNEAKGAVDPRAEALGGVSESEKEEADASCTGRSEEGGTEPRQRYRSPLQYAEIMRQLDPKLDEKRAIARYYRELARPYLIPFPTIVSNTSAEVFPENLERWNTGENLEDIDWLETVLQGGTVFPGLTTVKRNWGRAEDTDQGKIPFDLYIGIDCSGSMGNPAQALSWIVLGGAVLALSALRAGANVKIALSGEPGGYCETDGFVRKESDILGVLVSYLGTGYAFGIPKLEKTFTPQARFKRPVHILIISDDDLFAMLDRTEHRVDSNWPIAQEALLRAGGGGTILLHSERRWRMAERAKLEAQGWNVCTVTTQAELVAFASAFSKKTYSREGTRHAQ